MALAAEFKRASPSKGDIAVHLNAGEQAVKYFTSGASIISVLTEQHWFKGSLADLTQVREETQMVAEKENLKRPAILRKDFVVNTHMILEAAAAGADTVLLIVAITPSDVLKNLIEFCRSIDMEPLVEVHADEELDVAIEAGAKVIGVNNRNLHTFTLDLATTDRTAEKLMQRSLKFNHNELSTNQLIRSNYYALCSLSGMSNAEDVQRYRDIGVGMCLIGESLMRAPDPSAAIASLCLNPLDYNNSVTAVSDCSAAYTGGTKIVKVCGITNVKDALVACQSGASLIGIIFVPSSKRFVTLDRAKSIVEAVRNFGERNTRIEITVGADSKNSSLSPISNLIKKSRALEKACHRPLVVGVFQNSEMEDLKTIVEEVGLDLVQLHGNEEMEKCANCGVPAIKVIHIEAASDDKRTTIAEGVIASLTSDPVAILLDTSVKGVKGGTGVTFDWDLAKSVQNHGLPIIVAGGLNAENVYQLISTVQPWGVDVSSGVEESPIKKDEGKVVAFVSNARKAAEETSKMF